jgi:hypothetical protein
MSIGLEERGRFCRVADRARAVGLRPEEEVVRSVVAAGFGLVLTWSVAAAAQPPSDLPAGWKLHSKIGVGTGSNALSCASSHAAVRSWSGDVALFDGKKWQALPKLPLADEGQAYGTSVAVTSGGHVYAEASSRIGYFDGSAWSLLELPGWKGPIRAITVLDSGDVVVVGRGRVGLRTGATITSYDAGTWRDLAAVQGPSLADLWTVGQGGTVMKRAGNGWSRMATGTEAFLTGLHRCGPTCAWTWSGDAGRGYGRSPKAVFRWDGKSWSVASTGISEPLLGIAGGPKEPRAATSDHILRWTGSAWVEELKASDLGQRYHRFVGICATQSFLIAGDSRDGAIVRKLSP